MEPRASLLDPFKPVIDAMLRADLNAPRKQNPFSKLARPTTVRRCLSRAWRV
ncbi:hypothetical protein [Actinomadura sp. CNU-125]|uniref:hypothetical protein n=1 Tax=Actinomadura sp. CNU-125 TaxID=1904961 RepID=UPI0013015A5E|nr:hypothetical protein [Actinomadura sp. CNU-125]